MVPHMLPTGKLLTLPMPECPWSQLAVDFLTDLPESLGNSVIIVIIDWFSKSLSLVPQPGLFTALKTAELTFNHVFRYAGIPEYINRGQGMQFTSRVWPSFMENLELSICLQSEYHPQPNEQAACGNQEKFSFFWTFCSNCSFQEDWTLFFSYGMNMPWILSATSQHS